MTGSELPISSNSIIEKSFGLPEVILLLLITSLSDMYSIRVMLNCHSMLVFHQIIQNFQFIFKFNLYSNQGSCLNLIY